MGYLFQISNLRFSSFGRLRFNLDYKHYPRLETFRSGGGTRNASEYFLDGIYKRFRRQGISEQDLVDPPAYWTGANSKERKLIAGSIYRRTAKALSSRFTASPFPLQHPDLNQQNIIIDDEGNVRGIIDWEGAKVVPFESYDIMSRLLFKQWWQIWEGMEWTDEFAWLAFRRFEMEPEIVPKLSSIHQSPSGQVGRKLNPLAFLDFIENVGELIAFLFEHFGDLIDKIISGGLAQEILGLELGKV